MASEADATSAARSTPRNADAEPSEPTITRSYPMICRNVSGTTGDCRLGGRIQVIAIAAMPNNTPENIIALIGSSPRKFLKMNPKVTDSISIGTTIIMLTMPM